MEEADHQATVTATVQNAMIQAAATIVAARIGATTAAGNPLPDGEVAAEFEKAWVAISEGIARGRKAVVAQRKAEKAAKES